MGPELQPRTGPMTPSKRMILHWSPRSPFVRKVMVAAHELGLVDRLELRRTVVRMGAVNPDLLPDNPLGRIPTLLLENGHVLIESGVICEYFDSLAGGDKLVPRSGEARFVELSRHALATGLIDTLILWRNEREKPVAAQTPAWIESFGVKSEATLARLGQEVAPVGEGVLSLSQITLGCCLSYLDFRFADMNWRIAHPPLAAWHESFRARPSAQATEIVDA